jgi:predicted nucleic acid-binding protein
LTLRIVDTSAWIEWLTASPIASEVGRQLPRREEWLVPTVVQLELVKWLAREISQDEADRVIAFTLTCDVLPLDTATAILAAEVCRDHRLATADAVIYASALRAGADVLTCDAAFEGLPRAIVVPRARR